jgi:hypothetical protein
MKYLPWGVLLVALIGGYGVHMKSVGRAQAESKIWRASAVYWKGQALKVDSIYRVEVSELANQLIRYKNARRAVPDSVVTPEVRRLTDAADSTIAACTDALDTCDERTAARDSAIAALNKQIKALSKISKPSVLSHLPWVLGGVLGGVILSK